MFKKVKKFCKENKTKIMIVGGTIVAGTVIVALGCKASKGTKTVKLELKDFLPDFDDSETINTLKEYGAEYRDGYYVPFATKEIAQKFMEERGSTYQIDILDDKSSMIWISK